MSDEDQLNLIRIGILLAQHDLDIEFKSLEGIEHYVYNVYDFQIEKGDSIDYIYNKLKSLV